jgi:CO dehydrogenase/acetyl-CoA synthase beta subunit
MELFENTFSALKNYVNAQSKKACFFNNDENVDWEKDKKTNIIMGNDTAIELGHPSTDSVYFLAWTEKREQINEGRITLIGKDINKIKKGKCSFGEIILISGHGFNEENIFDRYLEMDILKRKLKLKGYMIRVVPQKMREWSRISKEAVKKGFSFKILGDEIIKKYKELEYIDGVEVIFVTSGEEELKNLKPIGEKVTKSIHAMNKILENLQYDCEVCEFQDVCNEMSELRQLRKKLHQ